MEGRFKSLSLLKSLFKYQSNLLISIYLSWERP